MTDTMTPTFTEQFATDTLTPEREPTPERVVKRKVGKKQKFKAKKAQTPSPSPEPADPLFSEPESVGTDATDATDATSGWGGGEGKITKADHRNLAMIGATYEEVQEVLDKKNGTDTLTTRDLAVLDAHATDTSEGRKKKSAFIIRLKCSSDMLDAIQHHLGSPDDTTERDEYVCDAIKETINAWVHSKWDFLRSLEHRNELLDAETGDMITDEFLGGFLTSEEGRGILNAKQKEHDEVTGYTRSKKKKVASKKEIIASLTTEELEALLASRKAKSEDEDSE